MPAAARKITTKAPSKAAVPMSKSHVAHHPTWVDMIKECIVAHPEDARGGVSRPTIKKFVESKYRIELNAASASQLNRAITSGSERGTFLLPKGPSGKVKLAPKARTDAAKENAKPVSKKATTSKVIATKSKAIPTKPVTVKKTPTARPITKAKPVVTKNSRTSTKSAGVPKKNALIGKKAPIKKSGGTRKVAAAKKVSPKKTSTKKGAVKKTVTGDSKKPGTKTARAPVPSHKAKPAPRAKPASKAKAPVAKKPTSKKT
ncbi:hypothetical protein BDZ94DRAFT_1251614 [Collybia nuda]|uniref:Histone H1 n=1 Tax=Collybia nuda TaxID=64659 RepID=A0A9P5YBM7_9AGAR|nr:hypothetical protein BDZ94DRAFT_1251614 [Collybia nuda]